MMYPNGNYPQETERRNEVVAEPDQMRAEAAEARNKNLRLAFPFLPKSSWD
jgi:hypothetical protein